MIHGGKQTYRFGEVQIDPDQRCIERNGEEQHLRERSFEVLVYLLENRGRLVKKEELIDKVWKVNAVTDDVLVQSIGEIRKAVGDDRRNPQVIQTIRKVGYRFIAPVEAIQQRISTEIEETNSFTMEIEEEISDSLPIVREHSGIIPSEARDTTRRTILAFFFVLIAFISLYVGWKYFRITERNVENTLPKIPGKKSIAVMFFDNQSADKDLDWLREGLPDMIVTGLSHSNGVTLLSRQQLYSILKRIGHKEEDKIRLEEAALIAAKTKADSFILGGFEKIGNEMRIDVQLYDARNSQLLAAEQLVVDKPEQILTQVDLLSLKIASRLGIPRTVRNSEEEAMTRSLDAYRYYSLAVEKAQALQNTDAIGLLQKAIAIDPQFAMAHARIGYAYAVTWHLPEKAKPHLQKAFELSERLTPKDKLYVSAWYAIANEDDDSAIATFRKITKQYPYEIEAYTPLAKLLTSEEKYEEAFDCLKQGLVLDPESKEIYNILGGLYSMLGRHEEGIAARQKHVELAMQEPNAHDSLALSYELAGRYPEAIAEYNRALELNPDFEIAVVHLANTYFQLGRYQDAVREYQRYIELAPSDLEKDRGYSCIGQVYCKKQAWDLAEKNLRLAGSDFSAALNLFFIALQRGEHPDTQHLKENFPIRIQGRGGKIDSRIFYYQLGSFLLRTGKSEEAIVVLKKAVQSAAPGWDIDPSEDCLANAYLQLHHFDDAIREYDRVLKFNPNYPLAHFHLAQAYQGKGDLKSARAHYQTFLQQWKNADPDLPEVKIATKQLS